MALEVRDVDRSRVIAGGVTATNLPQVFRNSLRSSSSLLSDVDISLSDLILGYIYIN
jgi:hypothetical protein